MARLCRSTTFVRLKQSLSSTRRGLATSSSNTPFQVFNTETKRHQRNRAALLDPGTSRRTDYLRDEVAMRLAERFMVLKYFSLELTLSSSIDNLKRLSTLALDQDIFQKQ